MWTSRNGERIWLYYIIKDHDVVQNDITNIFIESNKILVEAGKNPYCSYYLYKDKYKDPDKIIKLINLEDYMSDFLSILKNDIDKNHCSCRKFIYECTKIYNDMYSDYCSDVKTDTNNDGTCTQLSTFSKFYEFFISSNPDLKSKLPSLSDDIMNYVIPCESEKSRKELNSNTSEDHKPDSPIKIGTNAVLGTMAGVSSLFALSYKFTPLGKWFRPRHLRATVPSNNMGKQGEYELFHNGPENENISFDQTKYNVAYSPV
ncbi:PIR protein [Plasmodium vivax]|uniref:VIR protein n=1 Tax=Plasmodium vivax TaxID=5855 RepID=A0A564ZVP7_PLAVI|nr:PIR protein [Plasmodium vivax]